MVSNHAHFGQKLSMSAVLCVMSTDIRNLKEYVGDKYIKFRSFVVKFYTPENSRIKIGKSFCQKKSKFVIPCVAIYPSMPMPISRFSGGNGEMT